MRRCQAAKITRHNKAPLQTFQVPSQKFQHIKVVLVGPLTPSHGYTYLFTVVDRFSRWAEAFPLVESSAQPCGEALIHGWVSRFGVPADISSDRGAQFTSHLWDAMTNGLGTTLHHTTADHPQSNGLVEHFHRNLKEALKASLDTPDWFQTLPWVLLGISTAPKKYLGCSTAEMLLHAIIHTRRFHPFPKPRDCGEGNKGTGSSVGLHPYNQTWQSKLKTAKFVFIRKDKILPPLSRPYKGPFEVLEPVEKFVKVARHGKTEPSQ